MKLFIVEIKNQPYFFMAKNFQALGKIIDEYINNSDRDIIECHIGNINFIFDCEEDYSCAVIPEVHQYFTKEG